MPEFALSEEPASRCLARRGTISAHSVSKSDSYLCLEQKRCPPSPGLSWPSPHQLHHALCRVGPGPVQKHLGAVVGVRCKALRRLRTDEPGHGPFPLLGHRNIQHTVRYTELAPDRFKDFWRIDLGYDRDIVAPIAFARRGVLIRRRFGGRSGNGRCALGRPAPSLLACALSNSGRQTSAFRLFNKRDVAVGILPA